MFDHDNVEYLGKNNDDRFEILLIDNEHGRKVKLQFLSDIDARIVMRHLQECSPFCIEIMKKGR